MAEPSAAAAAAAVSPPRRLDFSPDPPPKPALSPDQRRFCAEALRALKEKLQMPDRMKQEFGRLQANRIRPSEMVRSCTVALDDVNSSKNRYTDVVPYDKTRVVLNPCKDYRPAAKGYINASFITASSSENVSRFIATQGPLPHTYEDFWEMILQHRCPAIVMLTRLVDSYKTFNSAGVEVVWFCYASYAPIAFLMFFTCIMCAGFCLLSRGLKPSSRKSYPCLLQFQERIKVRVYFIFEK
ncbi:hypothetical protein EUGRSUZ_F04145 [Eucalyptus grandis]|uniref:Uncharacterized protein n=2 Tax=Eucalyptus grandis TaxID=71139 RepID=A0ACC3KNR6_EUCGR|nr:hypothetical protein EUGRSUZ_F04145 [Eucalyptus grandis]